MKTYLFLLFLSLPINLFSQQNCDAVLQLAPEVERLYKSDFSNDSYPNQLQNSMYVIPIQ